MTTINVTPTLHKKLVKLKKQTAAHNMSEVIQALLEAFENVK